VEATVATGKRNRSLSLLPIIVAGQTAGCHAVPVVADLDGDGISDVVAVTMMAASTVCRTQRRPFWVFARGTPCRRRVEADMNRWKKRGATPDVIVGFNRSHVYCLDGKNGNALWTFERMGRSTASVLKE